MLTVFISQKFNVSDHLHIKMVPDSAVLKDEYAHYLGCTKC